MGVGESGRRGWWRRHRFLSTSINPVILILHQDGPRGVPVSTVKPGDSRNRDIQICARLNFSVYNKAIGLGGVMITVEWQGEIRLQGHVPSGESGAKFAPFVSLTPFIESAILKRMNVKYLLPHDPAI